MDWTASDVALVIGTGTTAITALAGIAWPIYDKHRSAKAQKKAAVEQELFSSIYFCVDHADGITQISNSRRMRIAMFAGSKSAPLEAPEDQKLWNDYFRNVRRIDLYSQKFRLDSSELLLKLRELTATDLGWSYSNGQLMPKDDDHYRECLAKQAEIVDDIVRLSKSFMTRVESLKI